PPAGRLTARSHRGQREVGLGTSIVNALAQQLDARVALVTGEGGTNVSITTSKRLCRYPEPRDSAKSPTGTTEQIRRPLWCCSRRAPNVSHIEQLSCQIERFSLG